MDNPMLAELDEVVRMLDIRRLDKGTRYSFSPEEFTPAAAEFFIKHHATLADMAKRLEAAERDAAVIREVVGSWRVLEHVSGNSFERNAFKLCADQINAATQEGEG